MFIGIMKQKPSSKATGRHHLSNFVVYLNSKTVLKKKHKHQFYFPFFQKFEKIFHKFNHICLKIKL